MIKKIALRKTSLNDYPGKISSVIFLPGCNLRCPWCHNPELVSGSLITSSSLVSLEEGLAHLRKRKSVLGGVVLSGGEPCLYDELRVLIATIKKQGIPVKLDTNGMCPEVLEELFGDEETRPDYIALDLKIAPERYGELISTGGSTHPAIEPKVGALLIRSAELIRNSGIAHEYRTLALPGSYISEKDIEALAPLTDNMPWYFRFFRGGNCLDPAWNSFEENEGKASNHLKALAARAIALGKNALTVI